MNPARVLIVDDESSIRIALFKALERKGYNSVTANTLAEAMHLASSEQGLDLLITDLRLPDGDGLQLMSQIRKAHPESQTIVITGFGTIQNAVDATRQGAFHYITKPFNIEEVLALVDKALDHKRLATENRFLKTQLANKYGFDNIIGKSTEMNKVFELIERVADTDSTVLITGESGTGKELVARAIHYNSNRAEQLMVPVNCGAIPGELLESELFGHVKGAFTGAIANRPGRFELANNGTIFLDEIGDMSPSLQVKLLRVLQERKFEAVGGIKTIETNVRIIAATNRDLEVAVSDKSFREDLFYRLNVIPIRLPALRERKSDIPVLTQHFLTQFNQSKRRQIEGITPEAMDQLMEYAWPGNVRELENLIERIVIIKGKGMIQLSDLPERYQTARPALAIDLDPSKESFGNLDGLDFNTAVDQFENSLIMQALEKTGWNRNKAAALLKLNRTTLVEKIKKKGLTPPDRSV